MRVCKLLRGRMVAKVFADCGLLDAETRSAKNRLSRHPISGVECESSGAEATPSPSRRGLKRLKERGTEPGCLEATPSPSRRGLKQHLRHLRGRHLVEATPSPSRRGLKPLMGTLRAVRCSQSTVLRNIAFAVQHGAPWRHPFHCRRESRLGFLVRRSWLTIHSSIRFAISLSGLPSMSAILQRRLTVGLMIPRSTRLMYVRSKPQSALRRSCERPA
jgi:hypothetical protein